MTIDNLLASVEELSRNPGAAATSAKSSLGRQRENADAAICCDAVATVVFCWLFEPSEASIQGLYCRSLSVSYLNLGLCFLRLVTLAIAS